MESPKKISVGRQLPASMKTHDDKICPRCNAAFECKAGDITHCQCYAVVLNEVQRALLANWYADCLCAGCIQAMKTAYLQTGNEQHH